MNSVVKKLYELYKIDWIEQHISESQQQNVIQQYKDFVEECGIDISFDRYIEEYGYDGECFASIEEFSMSEYKDRNYVETLLTKLLKSYQDEHLED